MTIHKIISICISLILALTPIFSSYAEVIVDFERIIPPDTFDYQTKTQTYGSITVTPNTKNFAVYAVSGKTTYFGGSASPDSDDFYNNGDDTVTITGTGAAGSSGWLTAFNASPGNNIFSIAPGSTFIDVSINNIALVRDTIQNGLGLYTDPFNPNGSDYFRVRFISLDNNNVATGQTTSWITLADYGQAQNLADNFILSDWTTVDLTGLNTNRLTFELDGSDMLTVDFGQGPISYLNTPTYLALDNFRITAVPEPSSVILLSILMLGLWVRRSRNTYSAWLKVAKINQVIEA